MPRYSDNLDFNPPPGVRWTTEDDPRRCAWCDFYSCKGGSYSDDGPMSSGKCFRDKDVNGETYYTDSMATCDGFHTDSPSPNPLADWKAELDA